MAKMTVGLPEELAPDVVRLELALALFQQDKVSFGQARSIAGLTIWEFHQELGRRRIPLHYDIEGLQEDLATIRDLGL